MSDAGGAHVDLWIADPTQLHRPDVLARVLGLLTPAERTKHDAFRFDVHRHEYLVTRALALAVLAAEVGASPSGLRFERNDYGCPRLASHAGIDFNLTNAPTLVAILVSRGGPVGVDLEPIARADDILEVASTVFAPSELGALRALASIEARRERGLDLWTLKESYIKARGMGLSCPLEKFAFHFEQGAPPRVTIDPSLADDGARWSFSQRDVDGHRISMCIDVSRRAAVPEVRMRRIVPFVDRAEAP